MFLDPENPVFQSVIGPLLVSFLLGGAIYMAGRRTRGSQFAVCAAALAVLAAYWLIFSTPPFPPRAASQKLGYLVFAAAVLSGLFASRPAMAATWRGVLIASVLAGIAWIAESKIRQGQYGVVLLVAVVAMVAIGALLQARDRPGEAGAAVLVGAFAIAGTAFLAPSASLTQMALAVAAATGGFLLWTWPKARLGFAEAGVMAVGAPLIWLGSQTALYTRASSAALLVAAVIAFAPLIQQKFVRHPGLQSDAMRPLVTGFIAAVIAALAVLIAYTGQSGEGGYVG